MSQPWESQIELTEDQAATLIASQFHELTVATCQEFGVGWDNGVFLVNDQWLFRFPRREIAVELVEIELRVLPWLADRLPLPVPLPRFVGHPCSTYPWPFFGYRLIHGRTVCAAALTEVQRQRMAEVVGRCLRALHDFSLEAVEPLELPLDTWDGFDVAKRIPQTKEYLHRGASLGIFKDVRPLIRLAELCTPVLGPSASLAVVHGDFYFKQLLVDQTARPCGVIDWGDVHRGDRAVDLAIAWSLLPRSARNTFRDAYGCIEESTWQRARFRALNHAAITAVYGHETGDLTVRRESLAALRHVLEE